MNQKYYEDLLFRQIVESGTLPVPDRQYKALGKNRRFTWDFAWEDKGLLVEVQGGTWVPGGMGHTSGSGYRRDCYKNGLAVACGWKVMSFTSDMVTYGEALQFIKVFFRQADLDTVINMFKVRTRRNKNETKDR
jgi:hypothetical protein